MATSEREHLDELVKLDLHGQLQYLNSVRGNEGNEVAVRLVREVNRRLEGRTVGLLLMLTFLSSVVDYEGVDVESCHAVISDFVDALGTDGPEDLRGGDGSPGERS